MILGFVGARFMVRQFDKLAVLSKVEGQAHHPEPVEGSSPASRHQRNSRSYLESGFLLARFSLFFYEQLDWSKNWIYRQTSVRGEDGVAFRCFVFTGTKSCFVVKGITENGPAESMRNNLSWIKFSYLSLNQKNGLIISFKSVFAGHQLPTAIRRLSDFGGATVQEGQNPEQ